MADTRKKSLSSPARPKSASSQEKQRIREKETAEAEKLHRSKRLHDEIWAIVIIALGVLAVLSLHTQLIGSLGAAAHSVLFGIFGRVSYFLAYFLILYGLLIFLGKTSYLTIRSLLCLLILFICVCVLNASLYEGLGTELSFGLIKEAYSAQTSNIGVFGAVAGTLLNRLTGLVGMRIIGVCGVVVTLMFIIDTPISVFFDNMKIKSAARRNTRNAQRAANEMILERAAKERLERAAQASKEAEAARQPAAQPAAAPESKAREAERALFETAGDGAPAAEDELPSFNPYFTPESIGRKSADSANGAYTNRQKQIIDYVTDDTLFGQRGTITEGYGLNAEKPSSFAASQEAPAASHAVSEVPSGGKGESARASVSPAGRQDAAAAVAAKEAEELKSEPSYKFPPIDILRRPSAGKDGGNKAQLSQQARVLEETLASFGVSASVENMIKGPTVTRFEVHPAAGVKVSRIVSLQDDLALNLRAKSLRIEAPIPGKAAVGIEISNDVTSPVLLREVLESKEFREAGSKISVGLGRNVGGGSVVANLRSMPHLLIAGATGSGKSVCINSIILSLLYKAEPSEVKLILVDPKVVELSNYNGIPHLLIPVVTEPAKASAALGWAVGEMNERYNRFAEESVRDLESYNETVRANGEEDKVLPQIVIVIDELADLMMAAQNAVEDSICRLAQKARAAGMHMVIATQRPSVDVITGVIKANVPSRIAFAVSSQVDSRTILDMSGAEKLVGKGDMLYYPQGMPKPERVQGCFVSDEEVNKVIQFLKDGAKEEVRYNPDVIRAMNSGASGAGGNGGSSDSDEDELLADAIECVVRAEQASVSMLQRRFRIGYNRSARLIDLMEERGIVGPADGSRPRKVLLSVAQFEQLESESSPDEGVPEEIF